jgi:general secretion pathway protein A
VFLSYYGLAEQPFGVTPDARFLYMSASHREALASLQYGIETGRGFLALIASPGMGKTTLLFQLMEHLQSSARTVFLFQSQGTTTELLTNVLADLGLEPVGGDLSALQSQLNEVLVREAQQGRRFVLVIDEAQNLNDEVLESVRMLSNFETQSSKLMQIVLAGQPPLADRLARNHMTQLRQRMSVICRVDPLSPEDGVRYIENRLRIAGYKGGPLFTPDALRMILERSAGIPRNINNICFHTLSLGCALKQKKIDLPIVREVLADLELELLGTGRKQSSEPREYSSPAGNTREVPSDDETGRRAPAYQDSYRWNDAAFALLAKDSVRHGRGTHSPERTFVLLLLLLLAIAIAWSLTRGNFAAVMQASRNDAHRLLQFAANHVSGVGAVAENHSAPPEKDPAAAAGKNPTPASDAPRDSDSGIASLKTQRLDSAADDPGSASAGQDIQSSAGSALAALTHAGALSGSLFSHRSSRLTVHQAVVSPDHSHTRASHPSGLNSPQVTAKRELGELFIESNIHDARVYINGKSEPSWLTPHSFLLPVGTYWVSVRKDGRSPWSQTVYVGKGRTKWSFANLGRPSAVVEIETQPPGVPVFIDGEDYGPSPVEGTLPAGEHTYKAIPRNGGQPYVGTFFLKPNGILRVTVKWPTAMRGPNEGEQIDRLHGRQDPGAQRGGALE